MIVWQECRRCKRKILTRAGEPAPLEGYCSPCYEAVTGNCADCEGKGVIEQAHLGVRECARCGGSGKVAEQNT